MADAKRLGLVVFGNSLCVFVADLRSCIFEHESEAAEYFDLSHTTISRYENDKLNPPIGYLACLIRLYVAWLAAQGQSEEVCGRAMLGEVGKAVREFCPYAPPIRTWDDLCRVADDYMAKQRHPQELKVLPSKPARIPSSSIETPVFASIQDSTSKLNPFIHGRPIEDPARFVGRQRQAREVLSRLTNLDSSSVVGERRIGKTSFLRYVSHPDVLRRFGLDPGQNLFAFVSLSADKPQETPSAFWRAVVSNLNARLPDEELREVVAKAEGSATFGSAEMTDLVDEIGRHGRQVVLLLDEFELIAGNPNFDLGFFNSLRSLAQNHPLVLITASCQKLIELCHSKQIASSPFFNIFAAIALGLLLPNEADDLVDRGLAGTPVVFDATEKARIREVTGRHPLLLQMACHYLFQAYQEGLVEESRWSFVLEKLRWQSDDHFRDYWDHCTQDERIALTAASMLEGIEDEGASDLEAMKTLASHSARVLRQLKRRTLLVESDGHHAVFSPLFAEWIVDEVCDPAAEPDQEFTNWMAVLRGDSELGRALKGADKDGAATDALSKVKPQYRDMIRRWLHNESTGTVTRLLLIVVEAVRLAADFLPF